MNPADIPDAIGYNIGQGYSEESIRLIQTIVGAVSDGEWGPNTVKAVYEWQGHRLVAQDGKVGPNTWARIKGELTETYVPPERMCSPIHGIWVDDPLRIKEDKYWKDMQQHGITSVALMFERHSPAYDPYYTYKEMETVLLLAEEHGMVVGITDWPWPTPEWMAVAYSYNRRMFDPNDLGFPLAFYESDVEGNWTHKKVHGFPNLDKAGDRLVEVKRATTEGTIARCETTSFTSHTENGRAADVAPHMDAVFNQAYSVRGRTKKNPVTGKYDLPWDVPWGHTYGPGNMVKHTLDRSLQIPMIGEPDGPLLGAGLAAYDQVWPGHSASEAMMKSYEEALTFQPFEVRWWSFKWVFGHLATSYGKSFLETII